MSTKPLVVAARYKLLLLVPFLLIVPITAIYSLSNVKTQYTSTARLLAQESAIIDNLIDSNPYTSPAENRAADLRELIATDSFRMRVAQRIGMATDTPAQAGAAMAEIGDGTSAYANGRHLLVIQHTSSDPARARDIVSGIVEEFRAQYRENVTLNSDKATSVYQSQLADDKAALDKAESDLNAYVSTRPGAQNLSSDARYVQLQNAADRAQKDYDNTQQHISDIKLQATATIDGQDYTLRLRDEASLPGAPDPTNKRKLIALPAAGLLLALSVSAGIYTFLLRTDNRIRTAADLEALPQLALLGTIPDAAVATKRKWPKHFFRIALAGMGSSGDR